MIELHVVHRRLLSLSFGIGVPRLGTSSGSAPGWNDGSLSRRSFGALRAWNLLPILAGVNSRHRCGDKEQEMEMIP
jgi:hypothetical protein